MRRKALVASFVALVALVGAAVVLHGGAAPPSAVPAAKTPPAPAQTNDFTIARTRLRLPGGCRPTLVAERVLGLLAAFNRGDGPGVARAFVRPSFHPYGSRITGSGFLTKQAIVRFVAERQRAGDAWTARRVVPPTKAAPDAAVYGVVLIVSQRSRRVKNGGAKAVIDCNSGRILRWVGPAYGPPDVRPQRT